MNNDEKIFNITCISRVSKWQKLFNMMAVAAFVGFTIDHVSIKVEKRSADKKKDESADSK